MSNEDEELQRWLGQQSEPNLQPQAASASPASSEGPWSRARELMERQNQMQYTPQEYKLPEAEKAPEREDWKTILAMGLSLLTKQGRGNVGNIAMAGEDAYNRKLEGWRQRNSPEKQMAMQMQAKQLQNMDRQGFERDRAALGDQIGQELQMANAEEGTRRADRTFQQSEEHHLDSVAQHQGDAMRQESQFAETGERSDRHHTDSMSLQKQNHADSVALQRAQMGQSAAQFRAGQDFTREQHDLTRQHQTSLNNADNASLAERARLQAEARAQAAAARQPAMDARLTREFNKDTDYEQSLASLLDGADQLAPKTGDIPGVGMFDGSALGRAKDTVGAALGDKTSQKAERMGQIKGRLADLSQRMVSGAAGPVSEEIRYQIQVGAQPGATESEFRTAVKLAREHVGGKLKSAATGRESQARGVLGARGLADWLGNVQVPEAQGGFDPSVFGGVLDEEDEEQ